MLKKLGIALLFDEETAAEAIRLSQVTAQYGDRPKFVLNPKTAIPHMSLFHIMIGEERIRSLHSAVEKAVSDADAAGMTGVFEKLKAHHHFLFWSAPKTDALVRLHLAVADGCSPLRTGYIRVDYDLDRERQRNLMRYGYHRVGPSYHPHVTIRTVRKEFSGHQFGECHFEWTATNVVIGPIDGHGALTGIGHRIDLGSK